MKTKRLRAKQMIVVFRRIPTLPTVTRRENIIIKNSKCVLHRQWGISTGYMSPLHTLWYFNCDDRSLISLTTSARARCWSSRRRKLIKFSSLSLFCHNAQFPSCGWGGALGKIQNSGPTTNNQVIILMDALRNIFTLKFQLAPAMRSPRMHRTPKITRKSFSYNTQ